MITCIFTIDYEIYGNGFGSLEDIIHDPAEKLIEVFRKWDAKFVNFVEVAELEKIESKGTDPGIELVKRQVKRLNEYGFELALHLHPQWYNAAYRSGAWELDYSEYNLCVLPKERIQQIVSQSINYLRKLLDDDGYAPISFRAGNWLFQPTQTVAEVLSDHGIKIDSSVFKGGLQHKHQLDYRRSLRNGYYWDFFDDVNIPSSKGHLLEIPIYTTMVPAWKMYSKKRVSIQQQGTSHKQPIKDRLTRLLDFCRLIYPLKLDFCRMTKDELTGVIDQIIEADKKDPEKFRPIVAIGHTKDLVDFETVEYFLSYLKEKNISISTFKDIYHKCV